MIKHQNKILSTKEEGEKEKKEGRVRFKCTNGKMLKKFKNISPSLHAHFYWRFIMNEWFNLTAVVRDQRLEADNDR